MNESLPESNKSEKSLETVSSEFGTALSDLMERTNNNPSVMGAVTAFVEALDNRANLGDSTKQLSETATETLVATLRDAAVRIQFETAGVDPRTDADGVKSWTSQYGW